MSCSSRCNFLDITENYFEKPKICFCYVAQSCTMEEKEPEMTST